MKTAFEVIPRYSGGSPAMVDEALARRVAQQEKQSFEAYKAGWYGEGHQQMAEAEGLSGIVLVRNGDNFIDVITDEVYMDIPYSSIRYPHRLFVKVKGRLATYFFRRKVLCVLKKPSSRSTLRDSDNAMEVLMALQREYQIDPYGEYARKLWATCRGIF